MASFAFKAVDRRGRVVQGMEALDDEAALVRLLKRRGLRPVEIKRQRHGRGNERIAELLLDRVARMVGRGLTLDQALDLLARDTGAKRLAATAGTLRHRLREGVPFSEALKQAGISTPLAIAMIRAGEETGKMASVLAALQVFHERRRQLRGQLIGNLVYPITLVGAMLVMLVVMNTYIVPTFEEIFVGREDEMPTLTAAVFWTSGLVRSTLPPTAFALILALVGVLAARQRSATARLRIDAAILRAPFVGRLLGRIETGRFLSVLGLLLGNGVTVLRAFELARGTLTNAALAAATGAGEGAVRRGKRLRAALDQALVLTPEETLLLQVGEESRSLAESCHGLGETIENDNAALLQRAVKLIEPTVILVMGLVVGVIVAGLLLGVYSLSDI